MFFYYNSFLIVFFFFFLKDGNDTNDIKAELNARHAKEMEELRTYFEQKCLQMEKQYSEEIFSQQSKRISDNDSETEELTDDLYFGGAGDCLNATNSRAATSDANEESLKNKMDNEKQARLEIEYEDSIQALRQELEHKVKKIQIIKANYEKAIKEQKDLYERQICDIEAKLERSSALPTVHQVRKNFLVIMILCFINNIHLLIIAIFVPYLMCVVCKDCLLAIVIFEHPIIKQFKF